jgi:hypothetical protein
MQPISIIISTVIGYVTSYIISYPNSKINRKLPKIKLKNFELLPSTRITIRGRIIHFHHWFNFTLLLCISIFANGGLLDSWLTRGFLFGGIVQGLRFPDRNILQKNKK